MGSITNVNLQEIDAAIAGVFTITLTGSTTLAFTSNATSTTYTDESGRNKTIILSGALSATTVTLSVPNIEKDYVIINNSGGTVTVSSGGATTVNYWNRFKKLCYRRSIYNFSYFSSTSSFSRWHYKCYSI
jgi:hypothetical protein